MNIVTVSREFGSGGRELGKRLAELLQMDYYDSEIIAALAQRSGLDERYIEETLDREGWQSIPLTYRATLRPTARWNADKIRLLVEQKKVIEAIAARGKDFVIVGRNADVLLADYAPFNLFVCAQMEARINRCLERTDATEHWTRREWERKIRSVDKARSRTRELLTDSVWGERHTYHLTVNTTDQTVKEAATALAAYAKVYFGRHV